MKKQPSPIVRTLLTAVVWFGLAGQHVACAQSAPATPRRTPSTEQERADALRLVDLLETSPTSAEAGAARQQLILWLGQVPDLDVRFCTAILGTAKEVESLPSQLTLQLALSQAAYMIRNPQLTGNSLEVFVAGVDGAIRSYEAMKLAGGTQAIPLFENLKSERARGRLLDVVKARVAQCK
jgi:hypothetical protein